MHFMWHAPEPGWLPPKHHWATQSYGGGHCQHNGASWCPCTCCVELVRLWGVADSLLHAGVMTMRHLSCLQDNEPDPLDAFMAGQVAAVAVPVKQEQQQQQQDVTMTDAAGPDTGQGPVKPEAAAAEEDEPDPLDAFMATSVS